MKFNFNGWNLGGKLIFISSCLAFLSFFFKWVDFAFISQNGFGQQAYFFFLVFLYPLILLLMERKINKTGGYICAGLGIVLGIIYITSKSADFFGSTVNAAGTGPYLFIISSALLAFGVWKYSYSSQSSGQF